MARSHICTGCGKDLATLRAPPDPIYGLHLVVCPVCDRPCVRTRASVERAFRRVQQARRSTEWLVAQGIMLALFLLAFTVSYTRIEDLVLFDWRLSWREAFDAITSNTLAAQTPDPDAMAMIAVPLGVFIAGAVGTGVWLRFGLAHWKRPLAIGAWIVVAFLILTLPPLFELARHEFQTHHGRIIGIRPDERAGRLVAACASGLIALAGAPLGRMLERVMAGQRSRQFIKRRRRFREFRRPPA